MSEIADPRTSRAVLVGSAGYTHLADLPAVAANLTGLAEVLTDEERWGLPTDRCTVMPDPADATTVSRTVREAAGEVGDDGLLLVYFAGHGLIDPDDGELILAMPATDPKVPHEAGLPYEWVRRGIRKSPARRRMVILDCCYSGRAGADMMGAGTTGTDAVADLALIDETCLLVSAPRNRPSSAPAGERYTTFTGALLDVLKDGIVDGDRVLTAEAVWREVRRRLTAANHERPELREGNGGGQIPLVRNAAVRRRPLQGSLLVAAPGLIDADLRQSVVLVLRHSPTSGAVGVRLTTPTDRLSPDVPEAWKPLLTPPALVFDGGPVGQDGFVALVVLLRGAEPPLRFSPVSDRLGTVPISTPADNLRGRVSGVRVYQGYLGWGPGELESYVEAGVLLPTDRPQSTALSKAPRHLWPTMRPAR